MAESAQEYNDRIARHADEQVHRLNNPDKDDELDIQHTGPYDVDGGDTIIPGLAPKRKGVEPTTGN